MYFASFTSHRMLNVNNVKNKKKNHFRRQRSLKIHKCNKSMIFFIDTKLYVCVEKSALYEYTHNFYTDNINMLCCCKASSRHYTHCINLSAKEMRHYIYAIQVITFWKAEMTNLTNKKFITIFALIIMFEILVESTKMRKLLHTP